MRLLLISVVCTLFAQLGGAKTAPATPSKPARETLPHITLQFEPFGHGLAVSPKDMFLGYPFCSADGTVYLNARVPPDYASQFLIGVSPKGELSRYSLIPAQGLVYTTVLGVDAEGSDVYALVSAEKIEELRDNDLNPESSDAKTAPYYRYFILHFSHDLAMPDEIALDLPFQPMKLAATSEGTFIILGLETVNQLPVIALVDDSGQLIQEIDLNGKFEGNGAIVANAPQDLRNRLPKTPENAQFALALSAAQLVHYRDSVLILIPGSDARVITIRNDGEVGSTRLRLSQGIEAESLVPSDHNWFLRASDATGQRNTLLLMVDPHSGAILQVIQTAPLPAVGITCVHDGNYVGVHWVGKKGDQKMFLMRAHP
ncbi:MAG TPA: hypothetical protein VMD58_09840 [Acidobacteriaceae bacterium]|nr:hypothetical protein [Acidobacteriaceae bacterium]